METELPESVLQSTSVGITCTGVKGNAIVVNSIDQLNAYLSSQCNQDIFPK